jgi:hypothetical protein
MTEKLSDVRKAAMGAFYILSTGGSIPDGATDLTRLYLHDLLSALGEPEANNHSVLEGAIDDRTDVEKMFDYHFMLSYSRRHKKATEIVDAVFRRYGFEGLERMLGMRPEVLEGIAHEFRNKPMETLIAYITK